MVDRVRPALGLSIGSTNLAAATANLVITRKPVLTLYRERPPEVGVPSENPRLDEPGVVITGFVNRVADPDGIRAADGSVHRGGALIADAMRALAYAVTGGRPLPENIAVTYPAHWSDNSVHALGAALGGVSEWKDPARPLVLIPDAAATLFAVRANPGIPARGTVAVCDFGGSGTSITLMDAAGNYQALAPTVRYPDFSGDMIDQALLTAVMADAPGIGSLSPLRSGCRGAKEQLSSTTVTSLAVSDIRLTRNELEDAIRQPLTNFVAVLDEALRRNGIRDLAAVVSVGGGANIPAVTTTLSGHFRVPVITTPQPQLTAAIGAALRVAPGPVDDTATALIPAAPATAPAPAMATATARAWPGRRGAGTATAEAPSPGTAPAMAWSEATGAGPTSASPAPVPEPAVVAPPEFNKSIWRRLAPLIVIGALLALLLVGAALAIGLGSSSKPAPAPAGNTTPASPAPSSAPPAPVTQPPPPPPSAEPSPPPPSDAPSPEPPPAAQEPVAPAESPAPPPAVAEPPLPRMPRIPAIPALPPIPGINEPIPGFPEIPTLLSQLAPRAR
ncbi:molecular chaperone [Mycobacterium sp. E2327]|uniref:Hsp70 family protein n=1 Tax=Mycobacterium sp. E2327 TaxID=1834132 RepID=UPI0008019181|nr:molecular chaperone [Mycobacterium sp. E2327]